MAKRNPRVAAFAPGCLMLVTATATATGEQVYRDYCAECHTPGADGKTIDFAPAIGNKRLWKYRMELAGGRDALYRGAINGLYNMLPKGVHSHLSDDEVRAAVDYILEYSL